MEAARLEYDMAAHGQLQRLCRQLDSVAGKIQVAQRHLLLRHRQLRLAAVCLVWTIEYL